MPLPIVYCMMTQNRLKETLECINLVSPFVDETVIIDGGSIDESIIYLRNREDVHLFLHPWCDNFSAQRNNYIKRAREIMGTDDFWILVSDPDEQFEPVTVAMLYNLQEEASAANCNLVMFRCRSVTYKGEKRVWENLDEYWKGLFFRYEPGVHYTGNPHETLVFPSGTRPMRTEYVYEHKKQENAIWVRGCFVPGTRIITNRGYIPIEEVKVNDSVLDINGDLKQVTDVIKRKVDEDIVRIKRYGAPDLEMTKEHPIWASVAKTCGVNSKASYYKPSTKGSHEKKGVTCCMDPDFYYDKFGWVYAGELTETNVMHFPLLRSLSRGSLPPIELSRPNQYAKYPRGCIDIDRDLCRLFGYYLSEGSLDKNNGVIDFAFSVYERDTLVNDLQYIVSSKLEGSLTIKTPTTNALSVKFCHDALVRWIDKVFGTKAYSKIIPLSFIAALTEDERAELVKGIFLGDGYKTTFSYALTLSSPHIVMACWLILLNMGIYASIKEIPLSTLNNTTPSDGILHNYPMFRLKIPRNMAALFEEKVLYRNEPFFDMKGRKSIRSSARQPKTHRTVPVWGAPSSVQSHVFHVEEEHYSGFVYNLEVADTETYCLPYMTVHNCRNMYTGGGGPNLNTRNKLWVELKQIVKEVYGTELSWHEFEAALIRGNLDQRIKDWLIKVRLEDGWDGASEHREAYKYYFRILHPEEEPEELRGEHIP